jgi:hypothetical protein
MSARWSNVIYLVYAQEGQCEDYRERVLAAYLDGDIAALYLEAAIRMATSLNRKLTSLRKNHGGDDNYFDRRIKLMARNWIDPDWDTGTEYTVFPLPISMKLPAKPGNRKTA